MFGMSCATMPPGLEHCTLEKVMQKQQHALRFNGANFKMLSATAVHGQRSRQGMQKKRHEFSISGVIAEMSSATAAQGVNLCRSKQRMQKQQHELSFGGTIFDIANASAAPGLRSLQI